MENPIDILGKECPPPEGYRLVENGEPHIRVGVNNCKYFKKFIWYKGIWRDVKPEWDLLPDFAGNRYYGTFVVKENYNVENHYVYKKEW